MTSWFKSVLSTIFSFDYRAKSTIIQIRILLHICKLILSCFLTCKEICMCIEYLSNYNSSVRHSCVTYDNYYVTVRMCYKPFTSYLYHAKFDTISFFIHLPDVCILLTIPIEMKNVLDKLKVSIDHTLAIYTVVLQIQQKFGFLSSAAWLEDRCFYSHMSLGAFFYFLRSF